MIKLWKSFGFAWNGLMYVLRTQNNMQIHFGFAIITIVCSYYLNLKGWEWVVLFLTIGMVLSAEVMNTIIEKYLDFYHPEINDKVKVLKDMAAAYVLITAFFAMTVGCMIFLPKVYQLL